MKMIVFCAVLVSGLGGCANNYGITKSQTALVVSRCPILQNYSKKELLQAADELKNLPPKSQIAELLTDYSKLRDACRIVKSKLATKK